MFEKITDNVEIHQTLPDTPNMTTQELKITWDRGCKIIKEAFNKLIDKLNDTKIESTVLYENSGGISSGEITLSDIISNFKRIKIAFGNADEMDFKEFDINDGELTKIHLITGYMATDTIYQIKIADLSISSNILTFMYNRYINLSSDGVLLGGTVNYIKIFKVIGYR